VGRWALRGAFATGWFLQWVLLLATMVALYVYSRWSEGVLSVPLVLAEEEPYYVSFPGLADYLRQTYEERGRIEIDGGKWLRVLAHKAWNARSFGPDGLPCFDPSVVRVGG